MALKIYRFGPFSLNTERYELSRHGEPLRLPRAPMELLTLLVERRGALITRQELAERLWSQSDAEVVKQSIANAVNRIRYTLRDTAEEPRFVQTVVGKGYRFIAAVEVVEAAADSASSPVGDGMASVAPADRTSATPAPPAQALAGVPPEEQARPPAAMCETPSLQKAEPRGLRSLHRWWRNLIFLTAVLLCAILLASFASHRKRGPMKLDAGALQISRFTSNASAEWISAAAISPDAKTIALAEPDQMELRPIQGGAGVRVPTPDLRVIDRIAWFPDNNQFLVSGLERHSGLPEVWLYSRAGYGAVKMRGDARMGVPSPSGAQVAFLNGSASELWVMDAVGQQPRRLLQMTANTILGPLTWMPDGHTLLVQRREYDARVPAPAWDEQNAMRASRIAVDLTNDQVRSTGEAVWMQDTVVLARNELLYTQESDHDVSLWSVFLDSHTGAFRSTPHLLQKMDVRNVTAAADGTLAGIVVKIRPQVLMGNLMANPLRLEKIRPLSDEHASAYPHAWSSDSKSLIFEQLDSPGDRWRLLSQSLTGATPDAIVVSPLNQATPRYTPDHRWLLFAGRVEGTRPSQIFRVGPRGGVPELVRTDGPGADFRCPLRAGTCLMRKVDDLKRLVFLPLDPVRGAGQPVAVLDWKATNRLGDWDISPDGRQIVLTSPEVSNPSLLSIDLPSGRSGRIPLNVSRPVESVNWDAAGKGWFLSLANGRGRDMVYASPNRQPVFLRQTTGMTYAVPSPDGTKLAFLDQSVDSNVWLLRRR